MGEEVLTRYPHEFSGGQRQRIAIARAIILNPQFIVADEPVSALDVSIQAQIINLLIELKEHLNLTMLFISHDLGVVRNIAENVVVMQRGKAVEQGACREVLEHPASEYVKNLIAAVPRIKFGIIPSNANA